MQKRNIELPFPMLKEMVKIYIEGRLAIPRVYEEQSIDGRNLDLVGEKEIKGEVYKVFFEIKEGVVEPGYIEEYLDFCLKQKPFGAYLLMPVTKGEARFWEDERFRSKRELKVIPIEEVYKYIFYSYHTKFDTIDGKIMLILEPRFKPEEE